MSLVSHLKDIKQQNKQIIKLIQCNDYLAGDIDCIKNKIACELSPTINLRFILQLVDLTLCLLCNFSCFCQLKDFQTHIICIIFSGIPQAATGMSNILDPDQA